MLVALWTFPDKQNERPRLCALPDKPNAFTTPLDLEFAVPTEFAVHLLSVEEGMLLVDIDDGFRQITPINPCKLYLTPNRPERPGFSVSKVKYKPKGNGNYEIFFDRDRGWERWEPNKKMY